MSDANTNVRRDEGQQRYILEVNGEELGFADYEENSNQTIFTRTEVDPSLKGQGLGSELVRGALDDTRSRNRRIVPVCSFVARYIERNPEWNDSVDQPEKQ